MSLATFSPLPQPKLVLYLATVPQRDTRLRWLGYIPRYSSPAKDGHLFQSAVSWLRVEPTTVSCESGVLTSRSPRNELLLLLLLLLLLKLYLFKWHCHEKRCSGTLHSQQDMGKRKNSALVSSNRQSSSGREMISVLVGRWWVTVQLVQLTVDCSKRRQGMNGRPRLIVWREGRVDLGWVGSISAFWWVILDRGSQKIKLSICCIESVWNVNRPPATWDRWRWCRAVNC